MRIRLQINDFLEELYMKKIGIMLFLVTLACGLVFANLFSFGRASGGLFDFSFVNGVEGSGTTVTETRDLTGFRSVDVGGVFQVEITAQKDFAVEVEADDNLIGLIRTEVRSGVLHIEAENKFSSDNQVRIRISAPDIEGLFVSGAAKVDVSNLKNSGLTVDSSGAAKIVLAGESSKLNIDVSGAAKVDSENLLSKIAVVETSGASQVSVNVTEELRADATGASKIVYTGSPASVIEKTSGSSKVRSR